MIRFFLVLLLLFPSVSFATEYITGASTCEAAFAAGPTGMGIPTVPYYYMDHGLTVVYLTNANNGSPSGPYCFDAGERMLKYGTSTQVYHRSTVDAADPQGSCTDPADYRVWSRSKNVQARYQTVQDCPGYADTDGDGIPDVLDICVGTPQGTPVDATGCETEPPECLNGVQDNGETGIDCGIPACTDGDNVCTTYCPVGFSAETRPPDNLTACYSDDSTELYTVPAVLGVCPSNMFVSTSDSSKCVSWSMATFASGDYLDEPPAPAADSTPWNNVFTQEDTTYDYVSTVYNGVTTEVDTTSTSGTSDTGSAVEQETVVTTVTAADGSKVETTVTSDNALSPSGVVSGTTTTIVRTYDPVGTLLGQTSDVEEVGSTPEADAPFSAPAGLGETGDYVETAKLDLFKTRYEEFITAIEAAPIYAPVATLFTGPDTSTKSPTFTLNMGSYGSTSFGLDAYDDTWDALGLLFLFLASFTAARMIFLRGATSNHA